MSQKTINIQYEIILLLLKGESHGRAISQELKLPLTSVQRWLKSLAELNILDSKTEGKNKLYFLKKNVSARKYAYNAENYKLLKLTRQYPILQPIIEEITKKSDSSLIILFGSYAKGIAHKGSDMDIYIQTRNLKEKEEIENIHSKLSVKIGEFDAESLLAKEIIKNHAIIKGVEEFYEKTKFFC